MAFTFHELKAKTVADLREIAKGIQHEAVQGYTQLNKDHLLLALCKALDISTHDHHAVGGIDKAGLKAKLRALRAERAAALEAGDHQKLKAVRRHIHAVNHDIRRHTLAD
jgi:DNA-binding IclR family transcriptional regulator